MAKPKIPKPGTSQTLATPSATQAKADQANPAQSKSGFSTAEIEKIADLANLELTDEEKRTFVRQFGEILSYFKKIEAVETASVDRAAQEQPRPRYREDRAERSGVSPEDFSAYLENGHFKVPRVIE